MNETVGQWGMGIHIKTRTTYGGYIRNVVYEDNVFHTAGVYGNFDIILVHFWRVSQLHPHAPCDMLYLVPMLVVC